MSQFRLRIVAAACGSLVSLLLGIVGAVTIIFGFIGLFGIPVGAILGFAFGPRLARAAGQKRIVLITSVLAMPLGVGLYWLAAAIGESKGASLFDLVKYVLSYGLLYGGIGVAYGFPMALLVAAIAAKLFRSRVDRVDRLWKPATVFVAIVAMITVGALASEAMHPGDEAARVGQQVRLTYRVDNQSTAELMLDIRSYWHGDVVGGSSTAVGTGDCTTTGDGDQLISSDWAIWLRPGYLEWADRPPETPIVSNATWTGTGDIRMTIVIDPDGSARAVPGMEPCPNL